VPAAPFTVSELAAALAAIGCFEGRPLVAVATSGGPDSLALAILADRWARGQGGVAWAVTVDHRLRPDSAGEARRVGDWLAARGIPHAVLAWEGERPVAGIEEAAREARYRLLGRWCREHGCLHLLVAHHREDQVETFLIRRAAGSGPAGLAAMAPVRELAGCRLVRPLLAVPRARLAAVLAAEGQEYVSDPSNRDPRFARARLRRDGTAEGTALAAALAAIRRHGEERVAEERRMYRLTARAVVLHPAGFAVLDPAPLAAAPDERAMALLARLVLTLGGARHAPRRERLARLRARLAAAAPRAATLGGCRFVPWRGQVLVLRELAAAAPPTPLDPGAAAVAWDCRFVAALPAGAGAGGGMTLGQLGREGVAMLDRDVRRPAAAILPPLVYPALPAFRDPAGDIVAVPHLFYRRAAVDGSPRLALRPRVQLTGAGFAVV